MIYKLAIDADSILYKVCYRFKDNVDIEEIYFDFCSELARIKQSVFELFPYVKGDSVKLAVIFSPAKSFRNEMYPDYKANRFGKGDDWNLIINKSLVYMDGVVGLTDHRDTEENNKQKSDLQVPNDSDIPMVTSFTSSYGIRSVALGSHTIGKLREELKMTKTLAELVLKRLPTTAFLMDNVEADDVVNWLAREKGYMVAAIDKDVINANPTYVFNYNKFKWIPPLPNFKIEEWYLKQTLMGDSTDNIKGAKGIGEKKAAKIVDALVDKNLESIVDYFDDEFDALMNHRLVRMDQFNGERMILWDF